MTAPSGDPGGDPAPSDPRDVRAAHSDAVGPLDHASQPVLHIAPQRLVDGELGRLGPPRPQVGMPLRRRRAIVKTATASRGVAPQLPRDRRRRPTQPPRDLAHPAATGTQDRDLLTLSERQVPPRRRGQRDGRHAATLPKPPDANRTRHARLRRSDLARNAPRDRRPEPLPMLSPADRRTARRTHHRPARPVGSPSSLPIATPLDRALRRPLESALRSPGRSGARARRRGGGGRRPSRARRPRARRAGGRRSPSRRSGGCSSPSRWPGTASPPRSGCR